MFENSFAGKVIAVTGAASGMGAATARLAAADGASVVILDLPATAGEAVAAQIRDAGGTALFIACDVKEENQVSAAFDHIRSAFGTLHGLVNVAGANRKGQITTLDLDDWDLVMAVNVRGTMLTIKYAVPLLRHAGGGVIVNMASVSGMIGSDGYAAYHTSKGAIISLTRSLAEELAPDHIRVTAVAPGWVDTPFTNNAVDASPDPAGLRAQANRMHALGRMAQPDEVAQAILWLLTDKASFVTASTLLVDGGFMVKR
ncbi:MAG: SDR family NAD(P)-dependent oxidoreductase [Chloroflexota bacterium]|nr:SDR family NAD(P)-dependent oxidoreductase [Chloroflexota bacterium]